jgi:hypothetical protein
LSYSVLFWQWAVGREIANLRNISRAVELMTRFRFLGVKSTSLKPQPRRHQMRNFLLVSAASLFLAAPSLSYAACTISDEKIEQELSKVEGIASGDFGNVRRDVRTLRNAATVLQRYGKDEACQQVVATMSDLLRNPKASLEMRNKSMTSATRGQVDQQQPSASNQASTTAQQPAPADNQTTATAEQPAASATESDPQTTASTTPATSTDAAPMTMEERRTSSVPFLERKNPMSAAELIGADVYGTDNDSIGEIEDVIVSPDNKPSYALVSYGGFLGLGEEQAAVPVAALRVSPDRYVFLPMTADQLKAAPKLQRGTADWWTNENFRAQNDQYYAQLN